MTDRRKILAPIDGSAVSIRALDFAIERAKADSAEITVAFVMNRLSIETSLAIPYATLDPTPMLEALEAEANAVLDAGESRVRQAAIPSKRAKLDGIAAREILAYARASKADTIVMGTHGRSGLARFEIGSTAEDVIRSADVPVLVFPQRGSRAPTTGALTHILVATDGSPGACAALTFACKLARVEGARLTLCCVKEDSHPYWGDRDGEIYLADEVERETTRLLEEERARAASTGDTVDVRLLRGDATSAILEAAPSIQADLIVLGTHGRAGLPRFILGSVAEGVLRSSSIPVCTVRER